MEVSSSVSPNDSSSDSCSRSPNCHYGSRRCRYYDESHSSSRSPRHDDRDYAPRQDYSGNRDYRNQPNNRDNYYRNWYNRPSYYDKRYKNLNGFSPVSNFNDNHYPNPPQNWQCPSLYQGCNQGGGTTPIDITIRVMDGT